MSLNDPNEPREIKDILGESRRIQSRGIQGNPGESSAIQGNPGQSRGNPGGIQGESRGNPGGIQEESRRNPEQSRAIQSNPGQFRVIQEKIHNKSFFKFYYSDEMFIVQYCLLRASRFWQSTCQQYVSNYASSKYHTLL